MNSFYGICSGHGSTDKPLTWMPELHHIHRVFRPRPVEKKEPVYPAPPVPDTPAPEIDLSGLCTGEIFIYNWLDEPRTRDGLIEVTGRNKMFVNNMLFRLHRKNLIETFCKNSKRHWRRVA